MLCQARQVATSVCSQHVIAAVSIFFGTQLASADESQNVAKQLANPVSSLVSIPLEYDYDSDIGPVNTGEGITVTAKPVVPFTLNDDWNLISRAIFAYVDIKDIVPGFDRERGLADMQASFFLSPSELVNGWIIGAGPVLAFPTASEDILGTGKWSAGPTGVVLKQQGQVTFGILGQHLWDYAGDTDRDGVNSSLLQPFVSFTSTTATTLSLQTESVYDWQSEEWSVPINASVSQVLKLGSQLIQLKLGARYWADSPERGPGNWGLKAGIVFLFPS